MRWGTAICTSCFITPKSQVLAACDVDRWRRENAKAIADQYYAAQRAGGTFRGCQAYSDLREMLARDDVDAVVVATGDNWQAMATILAAKAGKDVYCEKPVSLTVREARAMVDAVRRYGRVCQSGLQQRSSAEFQKASKLVQSGAIGPIQRVYACVAGAASDVSLPAETGARGTGLGPLASAPRRGGRSTASFITTARPRSSCRGVSAVTSAAATLPATPYTRLTLSNGRWKWMRPALWRFTRRETRIRNLTYKYANGVPLHVVDWRLEKGKHEVPKGWDVKTPRRKLRRLVRRRKRLAPRRSRRRFGG